MPRRARFAPTGAVFHVTNRGNDRKQLFFEDADYQAFVRLLNTGKARHPIKLLGLCLMPNHFHALVQPDADGAMSAYFHWVLGCSARELRLRTRTVGNGHVFQQRFWSDPIEDDQHFLGVLRYIEANPVVAELVEAAESWPWSSMALRGCADRMLDPLPVPLPASWPDLVNDVPYGDDPF